MKFNIETYKNVGPLFFGMCQQEIIGVLGKADRVIHRDYGIIELYFHRFDLLVQVRKNNDSLCEVGFNKDAKNVIFNEIDFFEWDPFDVLRKLCEIDTTARSGYGSFVFPQLGISLTGFDDDDDDGRAMTAFAKGHWDAVLPDMKNLKI